MSGSMKPTAKSGSRPGRQEPAQGSKLNAESRIEMLTKHKRSQLIRDYLAGVVDPMRATRLPDIKTTVPTALLHFEETGSIAADATGKIVFSMFPNWTETIVMGAGTITWGQNSTTDPGNARMFSSAVSQNSNIAGSRCVSYKISLTGTQSFNNATGNYAFACPATENGNTAAWTVSNLSQLPASRSGTVPASTMDAISYYGIQSANQYGSLANFSQYDPTFFLNADTTSVPTERMPVIAFASSGSVASQTIFQIVVQAAFEVTVTNNSLPTASTRPHQSAAEIAPVLGSHEVRQALASRKAESSFLSNSLNWVWRNRGAIGEEAEKVALTLAPLAAGLLL